jgi:predicted aldo/keto reductase-like oxidoreductase
MSSTSSRSQLRPTAAEQHVQSERPHRWRRTAPHGYAILGMKPFNGRGDAFHRADVAITPQQALRNAMSVPGLATTITGMESLAVLRQNVEIAKAFAPMTTAETQGVAAAVAPVSGDGRFEPHAARRSQRLMPSAISSVPHRELKGVSVSIIGVGGSSLGDINDESEAGRLVSEALDAGINFFDNAWEYHDGMSEEGLGRAFARQARPRVSDGEVLAPMSVAERTALENRVAGLAGDGRLEHDKSTKIYDAAVGRREHGFPSAQELPA